MLQPGMDAAEDRDIKFQRASGDLIKDLTESLPSLLWKPQTANGQDVQIVRRWAQAAKTERLISLLESFQEWPQLLDPHLQKLLPPLVDAFLAYLVKHSEQYAARAPRTRQHGTLYPLPRAIGKLMYTFCKVRGVKVVSRFLNNEPKYLDPLLRAFIQWDSIQTNYPMEIATGDDSKRLIWEERYIMLLWLSHLLLAPFDLASMSSDNIPVPHDNLNQLNMLPPETSAVAKSILSVALKYVNVPGKEREAATVLLARLALRRDMHADLLNKLIDWTFYMLQPEDGAKLPSAYTCVGVLSFLARLGASSQVEDFMHLVVPIFGRTLSIAQSDSVTCKAIRSSALARKMMIKILRTFTVMALAINERADGNLTDENLSSILEDTIDHFLVSLADDDTPVRLAASKALSIITLKLDSIMAVDVIGAVLGSLEENILYEKHDGTLVTPFEARRIGFNTLKRNLSAVDAQRWHGLLLTLAHLVFRRAPPTQQLPSVLQSLVSGLDFEQRSATGSSIGTAARDASCFGIWALSRKYTTKELLALDAQSIHFSASQEGMSVVQMLAVELVRAACVDPSGNIRRGASAALQELVGRHPDTILEGISLVQVVDYHAVARRSRAMIDVAKATADLNSVYWSPLVESLMQWRGIGSPDAESRRQAARAIGILSARESYKTMGLVLRQLLEKLSGISRGDAETRHGCLLSIAAVIDTYNSQLDIMVDTKYSSGAFDVRHQIGDLWDIFDSSFGPTPEDLTLQTARPELTAEAVSRLVSSLSQSTVQDPEMLRPCATLLDTVLQILSLSVCRVEDIVIEASSDALSKLFLLFPSAKRQEAVQSWIAHTQAASKLPTGRGQILALGTVFKRVEAIDSLGESVIEELLRCAVKEELIEKRVTAVKCLSAEVLPYAAVTDTIVDHFVGFLNDYTTDRRGDIGSLVRVEALQGARVILQKHHDSTFRSECTQKLLGCISRLAAEKLDKVRFQAWLCLQRFCEFGNAFPRLQRKYEHFIDVSSPHYFLQLLELQQVEWLRLPLIQGIATSAVAGSEGLIRASRSALVQYINACEEQQRQVVVTTLLNNLVIILGENMQDDRYAIPVMELTAFLIDGYISTISAGLEPSFRKVFILTQKAHFKSSNIARLEAAIKVYAPLARLEQLRPDVLKKLSGMLLHPFPKVRAVVADYLFMETGLDFVRNEDWTRQPKQMKEHVERLRRVLVV